MRAAVTIVLLGACYRSAPPEAAPATGAGPAAGSATTALAPPPVGKGAGPSGCFTPADVEAKRKELHAADEAQWQRGLASRGLTLVTLPLQHWDVDEMTGPPTPREQVRGGKRVAMLGTVAVVCGGGLADDVTFQFARKGDAIYLVRGSYDSRWLDVPTCPPTDCTPPSFAGGCGAAPRPVGYAAELPAGTHFAGEQEIPIVQYVVQENMVGANPCPPVVPPPPPP